MERFRYYLISFFCMNWKGLVVGTMLEYWFCIFKGLWADCARGITGHVNSSRENRAVVANVSVKQDGNDIGSVVADSSGFYDVHVGIMTSVESDATFVPSNYRLAN